ncbi:MAG: metallophosphoesterase [Nanoarchaeota archaeon]|nr:metallophosphoesterase [Nanoarchaeota archaeon]
MKNNILKQDEKAVYAVFSDIQGNYPLLHSFEKDVLTEKADKLICLGDIVQKGIKFDDNRCIELTRKISDICVSGNHERKILKKKEECIKKIYSENLDFIEKMPSEYVLDKKYLFTHRGLSSHLDGRIFSVKDATKEFELMDKLYPNIKIHFVGHSHKASLFEYNPMSKDNQVLEHLDFYNKIIRLDPKKKYIANPGGVGLYFGLSNSYLVFDKDKYSINFKLIK